jgi:hypothetical protein
MRYRLTTDGQTDLYYSCVSSGLVRREDMVRILYKPRNICDSILDIEP